MATGRNLGDSVSVQNLWTFRVEQSLLEDNMLAKIYCEKSGCGFVKRAFFKSKKEKCPKCGSALETSNFNGRNARVSAKAEDFALRLMRLAVERLPTANDQGLFVKRGVICHELGLKGNSGADLAIITRDTDGPVKANEIRSLFEVKMSFIWNWDGDLSCPTADYDGHLGRPSIARTDSILKAIGKAAITRTYAGSEGIPFVVIGNTPPPVNYRDNIDGTVISGLIQKWISLTPNPLVVQSKNRPAIRNPKSTAGYLRVDKVAEIKELLEVLLNRRWQHMSAMVDVEKLGKVIKSLELDCSPEAIGVQFLQNLPAATLKIN